MTCAGSIIWTRAILMGISVVKGLTSLDLSTKRLNVRVCSVIDQRYFDVVLQTLMVDERNFNVLDLICKFVHAV